MAGVRSRTANGTSRLAALARDCRILTCYQDVTGRRCTTTAESLLLMLRCLGIEIERPEQAGDVLRERAEARSRRGVEPVQVAWGGRMQPVEITLPDAGDGARVEYRIEAGGENFGGQATLQRLAPKRGKRDREGVESARRGVTLPVRLPMGYHRMLLEVGGRQLETTVISAPRRAYSHAAARSESQQGRNADRVCEGKQSREEWRRDWGCFLPLYALRTEHDWGVGDFTSLRQLGRWVCGHGGTVVGTLPLMAAFLDELFEPSPYRPASRLFWNELYVDVAALSEWRAHEMAAGDASAELRAAIAAQRAAPEVDYREAMRLKRGALEAIATRFFAEPSPRRAELQKYVDSNPELAEYAKFRAACERSGQPWSEWPAAAREGRLTEHDYEPRVANYHMFAQWVAEQQLQAGREEAERDGCGLYLDLPIGVDRNGYDVWRYGSAYTTASAGAPPDVVYRAGQDWGLPALHPERIRDDGYALLRKVLATSMRYARRLRVDHVLGFHRLFCIPPGLDARSGAYLKYAADEIYAIAVLESHLNQCELYGENLGTVPAYATRKMTSHGVGGMWVAPYELEPGRSGDALRTPPVECVASLNTHDMPPLAAWWRGDDIEERIRLGLITADDAAGERAAREDAVRRLKGWLRQSGDLTLLEESRDEAAIPVAALLRAVALSPAQFVLVNLEDLWLETEPQNVPGTSQERPNWRRKAGYTFEDFSRLPQVLEALADVDALRKAAEKTS